MRHPKVLALSDGAFRLWVEGLAYCQQYLSDGFIPMIGLRQLKAYSPSRLRILTVPYREGATPLWLAVEDGVQVHDYLDWNDSRDHVLKSRQHAKERLEKFRAKKRDDETRCSNAEETRACNATHAPQSLTPITHKTRKPEKRPGVFHPEHQNGRWAFCGQTFCVPHAVHDSQNRRLGPRAESFDLSMRYPQWDAEFLEQGVTLPAGWRWLEQRIDDEAGVLPLNRLTAKDAKVEAVRRELLGE